MFTELQNFNLIQTHLDYIFGCGNPYDIRLNKDFDYEQYNRLRLEKYARIDRLLSTARTACGIALLALIVLLVIIK